MPRTLHSNVAFVHAMQFLRGTIRQLQVTGGVHKWGQTSLGTGGTSLETWPVIVLRERAIYDAELLFPVNVVKDGMRVTSERVSL